MRSAPSEQCDNVSDRGVTGSQIKTEYALIAQSVEHAAVNRGVTGSSPVWGANNETPSKRMVFCCFWAKTDSKDERHRATVRWTVATASDQAPAGARIESCCLHHEKSTSSEELFSTKSAHTGGWNVASQREICLAACEMPAGTGGLHFTFAVGENFTIHAVNHFTFCGGKIFHLIMIIYSWRTFRPHPELSERICHYRDIRRIFSFCKQLNAICLMITLNKFRKAEWLSEKCLAFLFWLPWHALNMYDILIAHYIK